MRLQCEDVSRGAVAHYWGPSSSGRKTIAPVSNQNHSWPPVPVSLGAGAVWMLLLDRPDCSSFAGVLAVLIDVVMQCGAGRFSEDGFGWIFQFSPLWFLHQFHPRRWPNGESSLGKTCSRNCTRTRLGSIFAMPLLALQSMPSSPNLQTVLGSACLGMATRRTKANKAKR